VPQQKLTSACTVLLLAAGLLSMTPYQSWCSSQADGQSLTAEQLQIYGDFFDRVAMVLQDRGQLEGSALWELYANRTYPIDLSNDTSCLHDIPFESPEEPNVTHLLGPEVLRGHPEFHLVDVQKGLAILRKEEADGTVHTSIPGAVGSSENPGILALSEIAFDKNHRFAVFKYRHFQSGFQEGAYCSDDVTVVMVKDGQRWIKAPWSGCGVVDGRAKSCIK
jgi:hypothetical protein